MAGAGLFGSIIAARSVNSFGAARTHIIALSAMAIGLLGWSLFATSLWFAIASVFIWASALAPVYPCSRRA